MKKGKKMPSIELEGRSEARFVLKDGKIVRQEASPEALSRMDERLDIEDRSPKRPSDSF